MTEISDYVQLALESVEKVTGITPNEMTENRMGSRKPEIADARMMAMYLAKCMIPRVSSIKMAALFNRDQSTVRHAWIRIKKVSSVDTRLKHQLKLAAMEAQKVLRRIKE